jgi:hypothetical protein
MDNARFGIPAIAVASWHGVAFEGRIKGARAVSQRPNEDQQRNFLLRTYFGADEQKNDWFISRAYLDMCRTLRGLSKMQNTKKLVDGAKEGLRGSLRELQNRGVPTIPDNLTTAFDEWHRSACNKLIGCFRPFPCYYGQAQKWINMTIKYCWFFMEGNELDAWYLVAHVPVDEFILCAAENKGITRPCEQWSCWNDPQGYEAFQMEIRRYAKQRTTPLALEHEWWMEEARSRDLHRDVILR